ncbi:MAG: protein kinase domain-containing protein, partial [Runella zeae]
CVAAPCAPDDAFFSRAACTGNLYNALRNDPITDTLLWHMILDVCTGMNYLHHRGCLHLDLKPLNLLVVR